jgi:hypothetical protein
VPELLERWRAAMPQSMEVPARFVVPAINLRKQLTASVAAYAKRRAAEHSSDVPFVVDASPSRRQPRACLGLFSGCEQLGFGFPHGSPLHLYIEDWSMAALEQLGLTPARGGQIAHVDVRIPRYPETVFRGTVIRQGAPVTDALQCWLDVSNEGAHGHEQAALIWKEVLQPAISPPNSPAGAHT